MIKILNVIAVIAIVVGVGWYFVFSPHIQTINGKQFKLPCGHRIFKSGDQYRIYLLDPWGFTQLGVEEFASPEQAEDYAWKIANWREPEDPFQIAK